MSDNRNKRIEAAARALATKCACIGDTEVYRYIDPALATLTEALLEPDQDDPTAIDQAYANGRADMAGELDLAPVARDVRRELHTLAEVVRAALGRRP